MKPLWEGRVTWTSSDGITRNEGAQILPDWTIQICADDKTWVTLDARSTELRETIMREAIESMLVRRESVWRQESSAERDIVWEGTAGDHEQPIGRGRAYARVFDDGRVECRPAQSLPWNEVHMYLAADALRQCVAETFTMQAILPSNDEIDEAARRVPHGQSLGPAMRDVFRPSFACKIRDIREVQRERDAALAALEGRVDHVEG